MNLDRAFVLLLASINAAAGFTPSGSASFSVTSQHASRVAFVPRVRVASALFSEVEEATEAKVEEAASEELVEVVATDEPAEAVETEEPTEPEFDTAIYIGNISFDAVESELRAAFSEYGTVQKLQMPLDRNTGRSRGFAFVTMSNADEHAAAIDGLDQTEVGGRKIYVSESLPKDKVVENKKKYNAKKKRNTGSKIYVGNLNFDTTMEDLTAAFAVYGEVKDCFIPTDYDGNTRGFGFIQMDEEDALKAIEEMNGTELDGRTLNVNKSLPKGTKATPKQVKLYVGNLSWGTEEEALRELYEEYGKVVDCYIPTDRETGQHRGFAFVTMEPDDALRAADETDGYELDGRILRVNEAQPKGSGRSYNNSNDGYDGGDAYDEGEDDSWGNDAY
eukprot:CAMPEP_0172526122 /NCGR_PEP_ID=MMETSP1067-20121228/1109_1 /TAXON_ID=265564 ORGANISM="Thalassiosira punctigera, Strain Tpunct2005C2" /NCGR_SAMPLE_ID=MMETSP1067 /ASSEMBLY_ACC=CAM_ASM_000444 /LENGTH=390 /DNA_ID=CAMNT_0013309565 /DNA_START=144 /DNA_END=1316 /DNA_ORIENTATION=+